MLALYGDWLKNSQAVFVIEYSGMTMKGVDTFRAKVRDAGGKVHVVKNTLMQLALKEAGIKSEDWSGNVLFSFATENPPALAKVLVDATKNSDVFKLKGGYLAGQSISAENVKSLAELPPLPVMRATLLGVISAPASRLVRTLVEPSRQVARVMQAYVDQASAPAAA